MTPIEEIEQRVDGLADLPALKKELKLMWRLLYAMTYTHDKKVEG